MSENAATAYSHSGVLDVADGVEAILKSVSGDDVRIVFWRGVDIVIVGCDAGFFEGDSFFRADFTESDADFHPEF